MAIVTISRGTFTGGKGLAECVAKRMNYRCLSREELIKNAAQQYCAPEYGLAAALDNKPGFLEGVSLRRTHYIAYIRAALAKEVQNDNLVYHGQVGHLLMKGIPNVFKVRVIADMEFRIKSAMDQHQMSRGQAIEVIKKVDHDRAKWAKTIYHVDWEEPSQYDLLVDLGHMKIDDACEWVVLAIEAIQPTGIDCRRLLDDLVLITEVRAQIAAHRAIEDTDIEIEANCGVVTIKGIADSDCEASWIADVVSQTPGVREIISEIRVRSSGIYSSR